MCQIKLQHLGRAYLGADVARYRISCSSTAPTCHHIGTDVARVVVPSLWQSCLIVVTATTIMARRPVSVTIASTTTATVVWTTAKERKKEGRREGKDDHHRVQT